MKKDKVIILFVPYQIHLKNLYNELLKLNRIKVFGFSRNSKPARMYDYGGVIPIHRLFFPPNLDLTSSKLNIVNQLPIAIINFSEIVNKEELTAMICFDLYHWYTIQAIRYKKKHQETKLIIYSETKRWPKSQLSQFVMRPFLSYLRRNVHHIDGVLVYTDEGKQWWNENVPEARVAILPAPVDVETFTPATSKSWLPQGELRILMNARYSPYKRHEDLFLAVEELLKQGRKVTVTFIGRDDGGRSRVEALVTRAGLSDVVTFLDPLPMEAMPALYHAHDVLVLPSYNEAIGMVVPEAMACGLPTITSDTVGANVYVQKGVTGEVFETGNIAALTDCLDRHFDGSELNIKGQAGRSHIVAHFTPSQIAEQFLVILDGQT